jgi:Arc/MetJ family transcription regulator
LKLKEVLMGWLREGAGERPASVVPARRHHGGLDACEMEVLRLHGTPGTGENATSVSALPALVEEGLRRLMDALQDEVQLATVRDRVLSERNSRVESALRPYFGTYPSMLLERSPGEKSAFRAAAGQLAETLLGKKTASALLLRTDSELGVV